MAVTSRTNAYINWLGAIFGNVFYANSLSIFYFADEFH
jgi:hypothetical protein